MAMLPSTTPWKATLRFFGLYIFNSKIFRIVCRKTFNPTPDLLCFTENDRLSKVSAKRNKCDVNFAISRVYHSEFRQRHRCFAVDCTPILYTEWLSRLLTRSFSCTYHSSPLGRSYTGISLGGSTMSVGHRTHNLHIRPPTVVITETRNSEVFHVTSRWKIANFSNPPLLE